MPPRSAATSRPPFARPTKPIGPVYDRDTAERLAAERGWSIAPDGSSHRRVVGSPEPRSIVELATLRLLVGAGVLVVCVGGGGIPVAVDLEGRLHGVPAVQAGWGTPEARDLGDVSAQELRGMSFADGSMGPKIEAACRFAEATHGLAGIGALRDARAILEGRRGTRVNAAERFTARELDAMWQRR